MAFIGKVIPRFVPLGRLSNKVGQCRINQGSRNSIPFGAAQYSPVAVPNISVAWERIASRSVRVAHDSVLLLNDGLLHLLMKPEGQEHGALLVHMTQLTRNVQQTMRQMVAAAGKDMDHYSSSVILLPSLEINGQEAVCFDLGTVQTSTSGVERFIAETIPEFVTQFRQKGNMTLFINPYYQSRGFLGAQWS